MSVAPLSKTGQRRLAAAEDKIERGLSTFVEVGDALLSIRDERLYRETHDTFEAYCRSRWSLSKSRAYQLIEAAEVSTIVDVANEAQARVLAPLKSDPLEVQEIYAEAEERGDTTAKGLAKVVSERKNPTQGTDDDAVGGKGSPSGAPATAAPSTGVPAVESVPAAPEGSGPEVSASGAQPPAPSPPVVPIVECPTCGGSGVVPAGAA